MSGGFARQSVPFLNDEEWGEVEQANRLLENLRSGCKAKLSGSDFIGAPVAWMLACIEQLLRHRCVALADGMAIAWNAGNPLSAIILGRSLCETVVLALDVMDRSMRQLGSDDYTEIDEYYRKILLSTRDQKILDRHPHLSATNILTLIKKYDNQIKGLGELYDVLSERAHPNSAGHRGAFLQFGPETGDVTFSFGLLLNKSDFIRVQFLYGLASSAESLFSSLAELPALVAKAERERREGNKAPEDGAAPDDG